MIIYKKRKYCKFLSVIACKVNKNWKFLQAISNLFLYRGEESLLRSDREARKAAKWDVAIGRKEPMVTNGWSDINPT